MNENLCKIRCFFCRVKFKVNIKLKNTHFTEHQNWYIPAVAAICPIIPGPWLAAAAGAAAAGAAAGGGAVCAGAGLAGGGGAGLLAGAGREAIRRRGIIDFYLSRIL